MAGKRDELHVIGAGFGRTGTTSTKAALEQLGVGPCHHMKEVLFKHREQARVFIDAAEGKKVDWMGTFEEYGSTIDWPSCNFYKELMETYPDAKVLLTVRPAEKWYRSALGTIYQASLLDKLLFTKALQLFMGKELHTMAQSVIWKASHTAEPSFSPFFGCLASS